jgi:predicted PurR-regulated permease PerM
MNAVTDRHVPESRPLQWIVLVLVLLSLWVVSPVLAPLAAASFVVLIANRAYERLVVALHGRRGLAAVIATVVITVGLFAPLLGAFYLAVVQAIGAGHAIAQAVAKAGGVNAFVVQLPPLLRERLPDATDTVVSTLVGWAGRFASWAPRVVGSVGWFTAEALLAIVSTYYLFSQGPTFVEFLRRVSPLRRNQTEALLSEFRNVAIGLFRGNVVAALFQAVSAAVGYAIFGIGHVFLLGAVTMIASFVPLVGTSLVWTPLVIGLILAHHTARAIGLLIWCLLVVGACDNLIRPLVSRGHMALPRLLLFLMLFGGLEAFGAKGLLLGPLIGSLAVTAVRLLARERQPSPSESEM